MSTRPQVATQPPPATRDRQRCDGRQLGLTLRAPPRPLLCLSQLGAPSSRPRTPPSATFPHTIGRTPCPSAHILGKLGCVALLPDCGVACQLPLADPLGSVWRAHGLRHRSKIKVPRPSARAARCCPCRHLMPRGFHPPPVPAYPQHPYSVPRRTPSSTSSHSPLPSRSRSHSPPPRLPAVCTKRARFHSTPAEPSGPANVPFFLLLIIL